MSKGSESRKNRNTKDLKRTLKYERDTENYRNTGRDRSHRALETAWEYSLYCEMRSP